MMPKQAMLTLLVVLVLEQCLSMVLLLPKHSYHLHKVSFTNYHSNNIFSPNSELIQVTMGIGSLDDAIVGLAIELWLFDITEMLDAATEDQADSLHVLHHGLEQQLFGIVRRGTSIRHFLRVPKVQKLTIMSPQRTRTQNRVPEPEPEVDCVACSGSNPTSLSSSSNARIHTVTVASPNLSHIPSANTDHSSRPNASRPYSPGCLPTLLSSRPDHTL